MAAVAIMIQRQDAKQAWGFRLQGGQDFRTQLSIKKVIPGTPAHGQLNSGDAILGIGSTNTQNLSHMQAHQLIKSAGNSLHLTVLKGQCSTNFTDIKPKGPVKFAPWKHQQQLYQ